MSRCPRRLAQRAHRQLPRDAQSQQEERLEAEEQGSCAPPRHRSGGIPLLSVSTRIPGEPGQEQGNSAAPQGMEREMQNESRAGEQANFCVPLSVDEEAQTQVLEPAPASTPPRPSTAAWAELWTAPFFKDKPTPALPGINTALLI